MGSAQFAGYAQYSAISGKDAPALRSCTRAQHTGPPSQAETEGAEGVDTEQACQLVHATTDYLDVGHNPNADPLRRPSMHT